MSNAQPPSSATISAKDAISRRSFLAGTSAAFAAAAVTGPGLLLAQEGRPKINIGLVGCGGRGKWIANLFAKHGGYNIAAVSDYFKDRADEAGAKFNVPQERRFTGLAGYKRMLEGKMIDALVIESPPYFHPSQAADAVSAGKHVYMAKPIAVDVPGCTSVEQTAKKATASQLCFLVDFQTRTSKPYQEAIQQIQSGELGKIISVEAAYHCPLIFEKLDQHLREGPNDPERRLRSWSIDRVLSGDVITEQNIHSIDVASWVLNTEPVGAYGTGGKTRPFIGDCWDRFAVIFHYPDGMFVSFNSHQSGFACNDILCRIHCENATVETHYAGPVTVKGKEVRTEQSSGNLYADGAVANIAAFHKAITGSDFSNGTVAPSVRSNLVSILGRTAAYQKAYVSWSDMLQRKEAFTTDLTGLKA